MVQKWIIPFKKIDRRMSPFFQNFHDNHGQFRWEKKSRQCLSLRYRPGKKWMRLLDGTHWAKIGGSVIVGK